MQVGQSAVMLMSASSFPSGAAMAALAMARSALLQDALLMAAAPFSSAPTRAWGLAAGNAARPSASSFSALMATPPVTRAALPLPPMQASASLTLAGTPVVAALASGAATPVSTPALPAGAIPAALNARPELEALLANARALPVSALPLPSVATRERLTLSPALASLQPDLSALTQTPAGRLMLEILQTLTGESAAHLQLFASDALGAAASDGFTAVGGKAAEDVLRLLVQGKVRSADDRVVDMSFGLSVQKQAGAALPSQGVQDAMRSAIEHLAQTPIDLDYPGAAASLSGHRAQFQALLDPQGLWPLQSFVLSGLLVFGKAREIKDEDAVEPAEDDYEDERSRPDHEQSASPPAKKKEKVLRWDEPTSLPADGGVPIITARRWLELELRHMRSQLRVWMALPPMTAIPAA